MEKKVYKIKLHEFSSNVYRLLATLPRLDYDDELDAREQFVRLANGYLNRGYSIVHITHVWNYKFRRLDGSCFCLYMFEDYE